MRKFFASIFKHFFVLEKSIFENLEKENARKTDVTDLDEFLV